MRGVLLVVLTCAAVGAVTHPLLGLILLPFGLARLR